MKRIIFFLAGTLIFVNTATPAFAASGVTNGTMRIGGSTAKISTVQMSANRTLEVLVANDTIDTHQSGRKLIANGSKNGGEIVSAVNGGFFSLSDWSVHSTMVEDGRLIAGGGWSNAAGISYDGKLLMGKVNLRGIATVQKQDETSYRIGADSINKIKSSSSTIFLNEFCKNNTKVPKNGLAFLVEDGIIKATIDSGNLNPSTHQDVIVYKESALNQARKKKQIPEVGDRVSFGIDAQADDPAMKPHWENAKSVMGGAVTLVERGQNVAHKNGYSASDQTPTSVRQRVFVAEMTSGELVMGTVNSSYVKIADALIDQGAINAVAMDGGSSSMLYSDGSFLKTPGRELTMGLAVVDSLDIARIPNTTKLDDETIPSREQNNKPLTPEEQEDLDSMNEFLNAVNQQMSGNQQSTSKEQAISKDQTFTQNDSITEDNLVATLNGNNNEYPDTSSQPNNETNINKQAVTQQFPGMLPPTTINPDTNGEPQFPPTEGTTPPQGQVVMPDDSQSATPPQGQVVMPDDSQSAPSGSNFAPPTSVNGTGIDSGYVAPVPSGGSGNSAIQSTSGILSTGKPQSAMSGSSTGKPEAEIGSLVGGDLSARGFADVMIKLIEKKSNTSIITIAQNSGHQVQTKDDALISLGIVPSIPNSGEVSRKTASVAIAKAHTMLTGSSISDTTSISDCGRISEEEIMSINYVVKNKMLNLTDGKFAPNRAVTMTEMNQVVSVF